MERRSKQGWAYPPTGDVKSVAPMSAKSSAIVWLLTTVLDRRRDISAMTTARYQVDDSSQDGSPLLPHRGRIGITRLG